MNMNKLEPIQYYKYDGFMFMAKRGNCDVARDIHIYNKKKCQWTKYNARDGDWLRLHSQIMNSSKANKGDLREAGIPLVQDNAPDLTSKLFAEAIKKSETP